MDAVAPPSPNPAPVPAKPSFREALRFWFKLGFISFGGPTGQIAIMHQELVERRRWISENRFLHALNYCMVLPGPEATQLATYIGWLMHKSAGGIVAGVLFVLPSLFVLILLSWIYAAFGTVSAVAGVLYGIKPAVTAIVVFAAWRIGSRALNNALLWSIAAAGFVAMFAFDVPFPAVVLTAGVIGIIGGRLAPEKFRIGSGHGPVAAQVAPAVLDDHSPLAPHHRFSRMKAAATLALFLLIWGAALGVLALRFGWRADLTQIGWFFTKAALLTFGGAYAVLPYVYQGAVEHYQWLTPLQMIDGLALGETTPGPLIMIVAFVGFMGAWNHALFGPDHLFLAGAAAATVATFFTFLPSFLFILLGAPLIETTHGNLRFTAPLTAITAAVVGVILNLALFFAYHVLWPQGPGGGFEWRAALIAVVALLGLFRYRWGIIPLIAGSACAGLILQALGR